MIVTHRPIDEAGSAVPGYLFVESRRHAASYAELNDDEVQRAAQLSHRLVRALTAELLPEAVFMFVAGLSGPHFHQHVLVRPVGTPATIAWHDTTSWVEGPRANSRALEMLCNRLRLRLETPR